MQRKSRAVFGLVFTFLLISISNQAAAEGGDHHVYLPLIMRPGGWQEVGAGSASGGGISKNAWESWTPSLMTAPDGTPYVAWGDTTSGDQEIYVKTWDGTDWVEVGAGSALGGGISQNSGESEAPSLVISSDDTLYVAWYDDSGGDTEIYIRTWTGNDWEDVGEDSSSGGGISNNTGFSWYPSLGIAPDGTLYMAWMDGTGGDFEIYVKSWDGNDWTPVGAGSATGGGISNNTGASWVPSLVVAPDGTPYVAWRDNSSGDWEIYVKSWNGNNWVAVGAGSASGGGISNNSGYSANPSLGIAPDGTLYAAWGDDSSGNWEIYVKTWNGSSWVEVGSGSASGGGISNNMGSSWEPSLVISAEGTPFVAWEEVGSYDSEIYIKTWDGGNWVEVGAGSANSGGISNNVGDSNAPSLVLSPDGTPYAAWGDYSSGDWEIYVKRFIEE